MNWLKLTLWTYVVFTLHATLAASLAVAGFTPHLVLAGLCLLASRTTARQGLLTGALCGLLADGLTDGRLGTGVICFSLSTLMLQHVAGPSNRGLSWKLPALSVPLIFANIVGTAALRTLADGRPVDLGALCLAAAGSAVFTGILVAIAELVIRLMRGKAGDDAGVAAPTVSNRWRMLTG